MSLSALIRKREPVAFATATLATVATHDEKTAEKQPTVANVATVAVANVRLAANDKPFGAFRWLIHFTDREPVTATFSPQATHAEALACYSDAVAAEPVTNTPGRAPTDSEAALLRVLIEAVYRDDTDDDRDEAMQSALADPGNAMTCYTAIASERGLTLPDDDDRRTCRQCSNLRGATCSVATPGRNLSAQRGYRPGALWQDQPHRCESFTNRAMSPIFPKD